MKKKIHSDGNDTHPGIHGTSAVGREMPAMRQAAYTTKEIRAATRHTAVRTLGAITAVMMPTAMGMGAESRCLRILGTLVPLHQHRMSTIKDEEKDGIPAIAQDPGQHQSGTSLVGRRGLTCLTIPGGELVGRRGLTWGSLRGEDLNIHNRHLPATMNRLEEVVNGLTGPIGSRHSSHRHSSHHLPHRRRS